jgi:undecaprenyl-diphosphatase
MEIWQAIVLGLVEGITEYLPISSTGHLIIASSLLGLDATPEQKLAIDTFTVVIQGGGILAVAGLYSDRVWQMIRGLFGRDPVGRRLAMNLIIAFIPAAVIGLLIVDWIEKHLFHAVPVTMALAVGGLVLIFLSPWQRRHFRDAEAGEDDGRVYVDIEHLSWRGALIIGLMQCVAMWPGTSRSMMTIVGGMLVGLRPKHAAEFSFLLGLPTLGGACIYKGAKSVLDSEQSMFEVLGWAPVVVGVMVATMSAAVAVRWLVGYLSRDGVSAFGWYRIALAAVLAGLVLTNVLEVSQP